MADTTDVAKVLYEWITDAPYPDDRPVHQVKGLSNVRLMLRLEELSTRYRIGIEDARDLLRSENASKQ